MRENEVQNNSEYGHIYAEVIIDMTNKSEKHLGPCQTSLTELSCKNVKDS